MKVRSLRAMVFGVGLLLVIGCGKAGEGGKHSEATLTGDKSCAYPRNASPTYTQCRDYSDNWYREQDSSTPERNAAVYNSMNALCCQFEGDRRMRGE